MNIAFLLAAGASERFGTDKIFEMIDGRPVIQHSLEMLKESALVNEIFIAANKGNTKQIEELARGFKKVKAIVLGGATRFLSVRKLTDILIKEKIMPKFIVIHNAVNPLASHEEIKRCVDACIGKVKGAACARKINSTIKSAEFRGKGKYPLVKGNVPREYLWEVETPQVVVGQDFLKICSAAAAKKSDYTDDISVLEAAGLQTVLVPVSPCNRKITTLEDLEMLRSFTGNFSIGIGEDSHKFGGKCLVLGGAKFKNLPGLSADSDGDVILHALCNAIASAIGEGSLGGYATDMCARGIKDSKAYLEEISGKMRRSHRRIAKCSISIEAKQPLIDPIAKDIKKSLSVLLDIPVGDIGITATSGENLTPFDRGEAIKCLAMVLLK